VTVANFLGEARAFMFPAGPPPDDDLAALIRHASALHAYGGVVAEVGAAPGGEPAAVREERAWLARALRRTVNAIGEAVPRSDRLAALDALFRLGRLPEPPPDGELRGDLVAASYARLLDPLIGFGADALLHWQGKRFDRAQAAGVNVFAGAARPLLGVFMPSYRAYDREPPDRLLGFRFRTYAGPGLADPDRQVLKIDYDFAENPAWNVRRVLDELVELAPGYYLGKAHLRQFVLGWKTVAFFALSKG
jgi:hypothetical protein